MAHLVRATCRLSRNPQAGFPDGDPRRGYTIVAPVGDDGRLDLALWRSSRKACTVIRFSPDAAENADGWLTHHGALWAFRYEEGEGPDEPLHRLGDHRFDVDEYITVTDADGVALTYRITDVDAL